VTGGTERSDQYVVGVDYGILSGRAVVVRVSDVTELGSAVFPYPHGVMDRTLAATGGRLPPDWALQVPSDYVDVLRNAVPEALAAAAVPAGQVIGIGTDFTCTVLGGGNDVMHRLRRIRREALR
jgi:L-ribulokinase